MGDNVSIALLFFQFSDGFWWHNSSKSLYTYNVTILSKMVELFALSHIYFKMFYIELGGKSWKYIGILDGIKFERNILTFAPKIIKLTVI